MTVAMNRRKWLFGAAAALAGGGGAAGGLAFAAGPGASAKRAGQPNVVVIVADDLGYNDISLAGNPMVRTPNIDAIGSEGVRFTRGYVTDAVCAPSRAGLVTGRYQQRFGFEFLPTAPAARRASATGDHDSPIAPEGVPAVVRLPAEGGPAPAEDLEGLPGDETTFAQMLKGAGYRTAAVGKWHLGYGDKFAPEARGFDESYIFPGGAALYAPVDDPEVVNGKLPWSDFDETLWSRLSPTLWRNGKPDDGKRYMTWRLADEASAFIDRNKDRPFALYLAFNAVHNPLQAPKAIYDRMANIQDHHLRVYYATIAALDEAVGQVAAALRRAGVADNTLIIFTSDNGGAVYARNPYANLPFRGWKTTYFQGGVVTPLLMRWPARIKAGQVIDGPASTLDIVPTLLAATGAKAGPKALDGTNLLPMLTGGPDTITGRRLYWRSDHYRAVLDGDFKLQLSAHPQKAWLFNLRTDPTERYNLAEMMPEKVAALSALIEIHDKDLKKPLWPARSRKLMPIDGDVQPRPPSGDYVYWSLSGND